MSATIDHLVYACPELAPAVDQIAEMIGVRPDYGGQHLGLGTHNALLSLGHRIYLEVIAPDPGQPHPAEPLPFGLDELSVPSLRGWAAAPHDLDAALRRSSAAGYDYGQVVAGQRRTADGRELRWRMTSPPRRAGLAVTPFLIDWAGGAHPSEDSPGGAALAEFRLVSPEPKQLAAQLDVLGLDVDVDEADQPALRAVLTGPEGRLVLGS
jgi:Glyoxalase-like domain